eukprot:390231-Prymnesium_polylepis.2
MAWSPSAVASCSPKMVMTYAWSTVKSTVCDAAGLPSMWRRMCGGGGVVGDGGGDGSGNDGGQ